VFKDWHPAVVVLIVVFVIVVVAFLAYAEIQVVAGSVDHLGVGEARAWRRRELINQFQLLVLLLLVELVLEVLL
jgi:hypothetical protein